MKGVKTRSPAGGRGQRCRRRGRDALALVWSTGAITITHGWQLSETRKACLFDLQQKACTRRKVVNVYVYFFPCFLSSSRTEGFFTVFHLLLAGILGGAGREEPPLACCWAC
jgi:hypothetical protein